MSSKEKSSRHNQADLNRLSARPTPDDLDMLAPQQHPSAATIQLVTADPNKLNPRQIRQLHQTIGNQAVKRLLTQTETRATEKTPPVQRQQPSNSEGRPLPSDLADKLSPYGQAVQQARIHPSAPNVKPGALATTEGNDIFLSASAPALDSPGGTLLIAHEVAHVVQQNGTGPVMRAVDAEAAADEAAVAVLAGQPLPALGHAEGPQHFEAQWHQATLTNAMQGLGFTDREAETAYFSNWMRDVSQAFVPIASSTIGVDATYSLLELLSLWKFGRSFTPDQMGVYNPAEHIDNPAGQINTDLLQFDLQYDERGLPIYNPESGGQGTVEVAGRGEFNTPFETLGSQDIASLFAVDEAGLPAYMERSREYIKDEIHAALGAGRTEEGLLHIGNFSHTVQDLFAHSNWVEIAVSRIIQSGQVDLSETPAAQQMAEREAQGLPPIENFAAEIADAEGNVRPMLMTGTFTTTDTIISIKEEVTNLLAGLDPFAEKSDEKKWKFVRAVLEKVEDSIDEGTAGEIFTAHLDAIVDNLGSFLSEQAGELAHEGGQAASDFVGGGIAGDILEGGAELLGEGAQWAIGEGQELYHDDMHDLISEIVDELGPAVPLVEMAVYVKEGTGKLAEAWKQLKDWAKGLPDMVKEWLLPKLVAAEKKFKEAIKKVVTEAYEAGVRLVIDTVEGMSADTDTAETNVQVQLEDLRAKLDNALSEIDSDAARNVKRQLFDMPINQLSGYISSGQFRDLLAGLSNAKQREELAEMGERISQLANIPEWARAGASHSQVAKDHADSPFFGAAFTMANAADNILVGLVREAWGTDQAAPGLEANYGVIDPDNPGDHDSFLETRAKGAQVLAEGHPEEAEPARQLIEALDAASAIPGATDYVGPYIQDAIDKLRENPWSNESLAAVNEVINQMKAWLEIVREEGDVWLIASIDSSIGWITRQIGENLEIDATHPWAHEGHDHEHSEHDRHHDHNAHGPEPDADHGRTEAYYERQINTLNRYRGQRNRLAQSNVNAEVERPTELGHPLNEAADRIDDPEERIYAEVDRIFAHPYDSNWWWDSLVSWANSNKNVLAGYIMARNSGRAHHHHHGEH